MPAPAEHDNFEVFRIEIQPTPSVNRAALSFDAGLAGAVGTEEGSGAQEPDPYAPAPEQPGTEYLDPGTAGTVPAVDEVPVLDDVTRTQLREIRVDVPTIVEVPAFDPPTVGE
jgi:hypothetical protein